MRDSNRSFNGRIKQNNTDTISYSHKIMKSRIIASLVAVVASVIPVEINAEELINPGILVRRTASANSSPMAKDWHRRCMSEAGALAGSLQPKQAKAVINIFNNLCNCNSNAAGKVWEDYGKNDLATATAMLPRIDSILDSCTAKYVTPYYKE